MDFDGSIEVPAAEDLQQWTRKLPARAGVYLLWGADHQPILLASTATIRGAVRRKLAQPADQGPSPKTELIQITRGVSWTQANSNFVAYLQFHRLARRFYPQSYRQMLGWTDAWWVQICTSERFGRLLTSRRVTVSSKDEYIGPFPQAKAAKSFIDLATDMFSLCRDYEILQQASSGKPTKACAYAQMDRCCGVCFGRVSAAQYAGLLEGVLDLAEPTGRLRQRDRLSGQMKEASARLDFELAANGQKLLKRLDELEGRALQWAGSLRRFHFLVIAPGNDRSHVQPWRIKGGAVEPGCPLALEQLEERLDEIIVWARQARDEPPTCPDELRRWQETISLVSYFLFRSHSDKCLYYRLDSLVGRADLAKDIAEWFTGRKSKKEQAGSTEPENTDLKSPK